MTQKQIRLYISVFILVISLIGLINTNSGNSSTNNLPIPSSTPTLSPTPAVAGTNTTASPSADLHPVVSVTDGDTIKVALNGKTETVRVVGINTPETVDPRRPVQCFGKEASHKMKELVLNQTVQLEQDETQADRDRYGRLLRFVFLADGTDIGLQLIKQGYAQSSLYSRTPHKYYDAYEAAENQARTAQLGLWNPAICPVPTPNH